MLTVIIATSNAERALVATLAALVPGATAGVISEVIVADAGSQDQTVEVADIAGCRVLVSSGPLGARLDAAARAARAPWLMFLRPGVVLDAAWIVEVTGFMTEIEHMGDGLRAAVFRPARAGQNAGPMLAEAFLLIRAALGRRPRPDQGLLLTKQFYRQVGGYRIDAADPETDLLRRLGGRRTVTLRCAAITVDARRMMPLVP